MPPDPIHAYGTLIQRGNGASPEVFTTIARCMDIKGPKLKLDTPDATTQDSPGGWEEVLPTILRGGDITFKMLFIPSEPTQNFTVGLGLDMKNRTKRNFQMVFPDAGATTWLFAAYVTGLEIDGNIKDGLAANVDLKITGQPTLV